VRQQWPQPQRLQSQSNPLVRTQMHPVHRSKDLACAESESQRIFLKRRRFHKPPRYTAIALRADPLLWRNDSKLVHSPSRLSSPRPRKALLYLLCGPSEQKGPLDAAGETQLFPSTNPDPQHDVFLLVAFPIRISSSNRCSTVLCPRYLSQTCTLRCDVAPLSRYDIVEHFGGILKRPELLSRRKKG